MANQIRVTREQDGTETWENEDVDTGEIIRYQFLPVASAQAGMQIEAMQQFIRGERGAKRDEPGRVLTGPDAAALRALPAGTFFRVRELTRTPPQLERAAPSKARTHGS